MPLLGPFALLCLVLSSWCLAQLTPGADWLFCLGVMAAACALSAIAVELLSLLLLSLRFGPRRVRAGDVWLGDLVPWWLWGLCWLLCFRLALAVRWPWRWLWAVQRFLSS